MEPREDPNRRSRLLGKIEALNAGPDLFQGVLMPLVFLMISPWQASRNGGLVRPYEDNLGSQDRMLKGLQNILQGLLQGPTFKQCLWGRPFKWF